MNGKILLDTNAIIYATALVNETILISNDKQLKKVVGLNVVTLEELSS